MLLRSATSRAWSLARVRAGNSRPARMPMMAMTTNSSIKVKATALRVRDPSPGIMAKNDRRAGPGCQRCGRSTALMAHLQLPRRRPGADGPAISHGQEPAKRARRTEQEFDGPNERERGWSQAAAVTHGKTPRNVPRRPGLSE